MAFAFAGGSGYETAMNVWAWTLLSVGLVSIISLIGLVTLSIGKSLLQKVLLYLVSFAVGALFGDACIHLIPETFEKIRPPLTGSLLLVGGILIFFVLEKFVRWRHCHVANEGHEHVHPVVAMNIVGNSAHNLIDGMLIGASYSVSIPIGIATTIAIILHEIPQEMGNFSILVHGGLPVKRALFLNFMTALAAFAGALISLFVGAQVETFTLWLLPITAGGFLYIAGSDLIPELHHELDARTSLGQLLAIILGVGVMALLVFLE
jgi:zinc and cadmium transporter